jgi:transcriptional regulator with XRE-family HTH domain
MARAALNWSLNDLARVSKVHRNTIANFETGKYQATPDVLKAMRAALEAAGVNFIDANGEGPGVRLRKSQAAGDDGLRPEELNASNDE